MDRLGLLAPDIQGPEFLGATYQQQSVWVRGVAFCSHHENGGRIRGCKNWTGPQWAAAIILPGEVGDSCSLYWWEGADLVFWGYKAKEQERVQELRDLGRQAARKRWGLPKGKPSGKADAIAGGTADGKVNGNAECQSKSEDESEPQCEDESESEHDPAPPPSRPATQEARDADGHPPQTAHPWPNLPGWSPLLRGVWMDDTSGEREPFAWYRAAFPHKAFPHEDGAAIAAAAC